MNRESSCPIEMDRSADLKMPSPKRIRLEAPESEAALDPATPVEDMDDLYGARPVQPQSPSKSSHDPTIGKPPFPIGQLPGLGMLDGDAASSIMTPRKQSQPLCFPEAEHRSSPENAMDVEPEDEQKLQVNGGLGAAVGDPRIVDVQTIEPEDSSTVASKILADENVARLSKSNERVSEAEAPVSQDETRSESEPGHITLDWHSSGTVIDTGFWLHGNHIMENALSPDSNIARGGTHAEVLQVMEVGQNGGNVQEELFLGAKLVIEKAEKTFCTKPIFEELAEDTKDNEEAEFEYDSSPIGSDSSSHISTDTSSSDDSDADEYEMLSPAEQARRLMAEDGGSDDDGKSKGRRSVAEVPRTLNEKPDESVPKPTVVVTEDMEIEALGPVENTVENLALIKANTSGEYQVLESGSLLCLQNRSVVGVVSETLGRVQQPYYSVRFTNATAIAEAGIEKGTKIFYVVQHSTAVFTQPLKSFKGSDASNLHDEEVGDDELEFSDDDAEAEHKRQIKQQRMAKRNARDGQLDGFSRGPQQRPGGPGPRPHLNGGLHPVQEHPPNSADAALNYDDADGMNVDDNEDEDGLYTPLRRPPHLHEILSGKTPPLDNHARRGNARKSRGDSRGGNRGRGGDRGTRDSERGGKQKWKGHGNRGGKGQSYERPIPPTPQEIGVSISHTNNLPPPPRHENSGYQQSTPQRNGFPHPPPQQSPIPSPAYQTQQQSQPHTHPDYPSQYPNAYGQSYYQQPPQQSYPPFVPQQNYTQYHQPQPPISRQGYSPQFASHPDTSFPPRPQYPPSIPPGAHINPNYFKQQGQSSWPQGWQQGYNQQQQQQASPVWQTADPAAPVPNAARLQELLRDLGRGGGQT